MSNQASIGYPPQRPASGILINQASADFGSRGSVNGVLTNQASASFSTQGSSNEFFDNQVSGAFGTRGSSNRILSNQASANFVSQGLNNRVSNSQFTANSFSAQNQGFAPQTRPLVGSNVVTSINGADNNIVRQNTVNQSNLRIISEFNGVGGSNSDRSTTATPEVTTYTGDFSRTQSRIQSNAAFNSRNQNRKVIVKLSDLHPLILGKLGAECTCKADPFAIFRGPNRQTLPINSQNRGPVDLANYDESDIYIDVDSDKENQKEIDFVRNIPSNRLIKTSSVRLSNGNDGRNIVVSSRGEPLSSTYLPPTTARSSSTYLPPASLSNTYLPSSTAAPFAPVLRRNQASLSVQAEERRPLLIRVEDENFNSAPVVSVRGRAGKTLFDGSAGLVNNLRDQGSSFDRYGPGGLRSNDETLQGSLDCARPGLFRHPKFCNKFYACHWDTWKKRYTLHVFNCPVHLAFDTSVGACNFPSKGPACQDNKLLV